MYKYRDIQTNPCKHTNKDKSTLTSDSQSVVWLPRMSTLSNLHVDHSGVFVTYKQRWVVISCVMSLNMVGYMMAIRSV